MSGMFMGIRTQRINLVCQNGKVYTRLKAIINTKTDNPMIIFEGEEGMAEAGDHIEHKTREGVTVTYVITDPGFHPKRSGMSPYYGAKVREEAQYYRTASDKVVPIPFTDDPGVENRVPVSATEQGIQTSVLFDALRVIAKDQHDGEGLVYILDQMEKSVGTADYPALYNAFMQAVSDRMSDFVQYIPELSRLLVTDNSKKE